MMLEKLAKIAERYEALEQRMGDPAVYGDREKLKELSRDTQFLLITHNRNTVEASNVIYGITMAADSTSQVVSLRLDEIKGDILK